MSIQFGKCNFDCKPVDSREFEEVRPVLAPYGPDGEGYICKDNVGILYCAFHTTRESRREIQPRVLPSGAVLTWDGRLDNRKDLIERLSGEIPSDSTDLELVAAAYQRWGTKSFADLVGDWALSVWDPKDQSIVLAKDYIGTRHLYYSIDTDHVTWCTILDPLVLFANRSFQLEEEYIAGWLSALPATRFTPYVGVYGVPPSSFVHIRQQTQRVSEYWHFDPGRRVRHSSDAEYEERFRRIFADSVRRRMRSTSPVLAELSGGIDSSSIVCMADRITAECPTQAVGIDTVSYYDDSEPAWNERPYFTRIEEERGRAGHHIDVRFQPFSMDDAAADTFAAVPALQVASPTVRRAFSECVRSGNNKVLLSGIGGDELFGGVPTPIPEIADLVVRFELQLLTKQLARWALNKKKPWFYLLGETCRRFVPHQRTATEDFLRAEFWLDQGLVERQRTALRGYESRLKFLGPLPSFQENILAIDTLRRQLACEPARREPLCEVRYPLLDRDLAEFMLAIPRTQVVRPGDRRSLMRRALRGIVPTEVLQRKRKAYVARANLKFMEELKNCVFNTPDGMLCGHLGILNEAQLKRSLDSGVALPSIALMRLVSLERWLRGAKGYLAGGIARASEKTRANSWRFFDQSCLHSKV